MSSNPLLDPVVEFNDMFFRASGLNFWTIYAGNISIDLLDPDVVTVDVPGVRNTLFKFETTAGREVDFRYNRYNLASVSAYINKTFEFPINATADSIHAEFCRRIGIGLALDDIQPIIVPDFSAGPVQLTLEAAPDNFYVFGQTTVTLQLPGSEEDDMHYLMTAAASNLPPNPGAGNDTLTISTGGCGYKFYVTSSDPLDFTTSQHDDLTGFTVTKTELFSGLDSNVLSSNGSLANYNGGTVDYMRPGLDVNGLVSEGPADSAVISADKSAVEIELPRTVMAKFEGQSAEKNHLLVVVTLSHANYTKPIYLFNSRTNLNRQ